MLDVYKVIEIDGNQYRIQKLDAKSAIKIAKLLLSKVLPIVDCFKSVIGALDSFLAVAEAAGLDKEKLEEVSFAEIGKALDHLTDEDMDKLMNTLLRRCYRVLPGGDAPIINDNGSYGVPEAEYDPILVGQLIFESIKFGVSGFFDGSRLTSLFAQIPGLFQPEQ